MFNHFSSMGDTLTVRELALLGVAGLSAAAALYYRRDGQNQRQRKNELAMDLLNLRKISSTDKESTEYGISFKPRSSDVFIVTYPKCGTTWMTQICHMLRGGDMNFGEIIEVCPWDEKALTCGQDLDADQVKEPRLFKSHLQRDNIAKGGKYIYVARNPEDVFVSCFHFVLGFRGLEQDDITMYQFADSVWATYCGSIWNHFMGWFCVKDDPNVLWVFFEDLKNDFRGQIERVVDFMEIPEDVREDRIMQALEKATFKFMSSHEQRNHFNNSFFFDKIKDKMGLPEDAKVNERASNVRHGKMGQRSQIPHDLRKRLEEQWRVKVTPKSNCQDYDSFRTSFRKLSA